MPLSDLAVRSAKPGVHPRDPSKHGKAYKLADAGGLYLYVTPAGAKSWRMQYRIDRVERSPLTFGLYPEVSLAEARSKRDAARKLLAAGVDPAKARKAEAVSEEIAVASIFETVAREWFAVRSPTWAAGYSSKVIRRLEVDVFPYIGTRPVDQVTPPELLAVIRRIEARKVFETAHRALESCSSVFRFAIATGRATVNPARDLKDALRPVVPKHFAAITDPERLGELLRALDGYKGSVVVRAALKLAPMLLVRPGELRLAVWDEFDLEEALWTIPAARMKREMHGKLNGDDHLVPLPDQAVAALHDLKQLTHDSGFVFHGERDHDRPMSDNTVNAAMRMLGFDSDEMVGHGFRATARTLIDEQLGYPPQIIEAQLAHAVKDSLGRAYNRTEYLDQRRDMLQAWADHLDHLRATLPSAAPGTSAKTKRGAKKRPTGSISGGDSGDEAVNRPQSRADAGFAAGKSGGDKVGTKRGQSGDTGTDM